MHRSLSKFRILAGTALVVCLFATGAAAQQVPCTLTSNVTTLYATNNGQSGNMFDIVATNALIVNRFDVNLNPGTFTLEVYVHDVGQVGVNAGSHAGDEGNPGNWTLIHSEPGVVSAGNDVPTPLAPFNMLANLINGAVIMNAGDQLGFYVTTTAIDINYTNGTNFLGAAATNGDLQVLEGTGNAYPFGAVFGGPAAGSASRVWNGTVYYSGANPLAPDCGQPPNVDVVNGPQSVLDIRNSAGVGGFETNGNSVSTANPCPGPYKSTIPAGDTLVFSIQGSPNTTMILVADTQPAVCASQGPFGQVGQIDLATPQLVADSINNALTPPNNFFVTDGSGNLTLSFTLGPQFVPGFLATYQAVLLSPSLVVAVSNAVEVCIQ